MPSENEPSESESARMLKQPAAQPTSRKASGPPRGARSKAEKRAWSTAGRGPHGGKIDLGRNVPSGPTGGSGRKTNLSRSS